MEAHVGQIVLYREAGPTSEQPECLAVDRPAVLIAVHPDLTRVDLHVFGSRTAGSPIRCDVAQSGKSPAAATIGDDPRRHTWRPLEHVDAA